MWLACWDAEDKALFVSGFSAYMSAIVVMTVVHISSLLSDHLHDWNSCTGEISNVKDEENPKQSIMQS